MPLPQDLVDLFVCPETRDNLAILDGSTLERLNVLISKGKIENRRGLAVKDRMQAALVRRDLRVVYPIREDVPVLLVDEQIALDQLDHRGRERS